MLYDGSAVDVLVLTSSETKEIKLVLVLKPIGIGKFQLFLANMFGH